MTDIFYYCYYYQREAATDGKCPLGFEVNFRLDTQLTLRYSSRILCFNYRGQFLEKDAL
jgi:hypothetical protein